MGRALAVGNERRGSRVWEGKSLTGGSIENCACYTGPESTREWKTGLAPTMPTDDLMLLHTYTDR